LACTHTTPNTGAGDYVRYHRAQHRNEDWEEYTECEGNILVMMKYGEHNGRREKEIKLGSDISLLLIVHLLQINFISWKGLKNALDKYFNIYNDCILKF
jgi:hypothetical protein